MADNTTPSADPTVATDDIAGAHFQRVKLVDGTLDGSDAIPGSAARGLCVDPRPSMVRVTATPTISTSAYTVKDAVGGLLEFASIARSAGGAFRLEAVQISDLADQAADLDLVLFDRTITAPTDNAAFDPTDAELAYVVGIVPVTSGDYARLNDNGVASRTVGLAGVLNGTSLFGVLVARSTPTYVSTADLAVTVTAARL